MKNVLIKIGIFCLFTVICLDTYGAADRIRNVSAIEVRGLSLLTKNEIVSGDCIKAGPGGITVNLSLLERHLGSVNLISRYGISEDDGRLVIDVSEKRITALLAVRKGDRIIPFEVDESLSPVRAGRIYSTDNPLVVLGDEGRITGAVREFLGRMNLLRSRDGDLYREIAQVTLTDGDALSARMRGRRTEFTASSADILFRMLKPAVVYCDSRGRYPERVILMKEGFVLR